jgi:hypothetical protein
MSEVLEGDRASSKRKLDAQSKPVQSSLPSSGSSQNAKKPYPHAILETICVSSL